MTPNEAADRDTDTVSVDATEEDRGPHTRRGRVWVRVLLGVVLGVIVLAAVADLVTSSPRLCGSCHEMEPRTQAWARSAHSEVKCVACHQKPTEIYELPQRIVGRTALLVRDTRAHMSGDFESPVETRTAGVPPIADEVCLQCHTADREATSGFRIRIDHAEHAKRNGSCVSCHVRTAHPVPTRSNALTLMGQCFTCHGTPEQPKASAECGVCHPSGFELRPASHANVAWRKSHAPVAETDRKQCTMCHEQSFCDACHGLEMPHPAGWDKGATGHAAFANTDRSVCSRCHEGEPNLCTMCHHQAFDPEKGTWVRQHPLEVRQQTPEFCLKCHRPSYCVRCHVAWATSGTLTVTEQ